MVVAVCNHIVDTVAQVVVVAAVVELNNIDFVDRNIDTVDTEEWVVVEAAVDIELLVVDRLAEVRGFGNRFGVLQDPKWGKVMGVEAAVLPAPS